MEKKTEAYASKHLDFIDSIHLFTHTLLKWVMMDRKRESLYSMDKEKQNIKHKLVK